MEKHLFEKMQRRNVHFILGLHVQTTLRVGLFRGCRFILYIQVLSSNTRLVRFYGRFCLLS